jgi:hypothetical protein
VQKSLAVSFSKLKTKTKAQKLGGSVVATNACCFTVLCGRVERERNFPFAQAFWLLLENNYLFYTIFSILQLRDIL